MADDSERRGLTYRVAPQVGVELISESGSPPQLDFEQDGLRSLELKNFTGRIIFHRAEAPDASSVYTGSVLSSRAPSIRGDFSETHGSDCIEAEIKFSDKEAKAAAKNGGGGVSFMDAVAMAAVASTPPVKNQATIQIENTAPPATEEGLQVPEMAPGHERHLTPESIAIAKKFAGDLKEKRPVVQKSLSKQKAIFRKVLAATAAKRNIPDKVKVARYATQMASPSGPPPTPLHTMCARRRVTLDELFDCLGDNPGAIKVKDGRGRYPLHILGDNEAMITSSTGRETLTAFAGHLINEFPGAALVKDSDGFLPFCRIIADWIDWVNEEGKQKQTTESSTSPEGHRHKSNFYDQGPQSKFADSSRRNWVGISMNRSLKKFSRVEIWEETEWCFSMLSTELDILARNDALPTFQRIRVTGSNPHDTRDSRTVLVESLIGRLPQLMQTVFLVDDDGQDTRQRVLDMVVFQRLLLCPHMVGSWLTDMLNHGGVPANRAVDFLWRVSHSTIDDFTGGFGAAHTSDWEGFRSTREEVFTTIGGLKGIIASLVTLDMQQTQRAASTAAIWHTMNVKLSRPFVLGLVLIDLVLHFTLMLAFRSVVQPYSALATINAAAPASVIYFICAHYILRKACEAWALYTVSMSVLQGYFSNMWTLFDTIAILMTFGATIYHDRHPGEYLNGVNAFVTGLLWIKVLGFLKVVNKEMSTFVLALSQILYDIRLFMVVLIVCVFMFGDMFYIAVSTKDNGQFCEQEQESGAIEDFCTSPWNAYLRTYSMLLGDFELDDITETTGTTLLFVMFTILGVVILLNVLIAVISDSYEKATMSGSLLFGRARVFYVAQNEALEGILQPRPSRPRREGERRCKPFKFLRHTLRWSVLLAILGTAVHSLLFNIGSCIAAVKAERWATFSIECILVTLLFAALWVVSTFVLDNILRVLLPDKAEMVYDMMNRLNGAFISLAANWLFGLNKETVTVLSSDDAEDEDWNGKVRYLENVMDRMMQEVKTDLKAEILEMKNEMHDHFEDATMYESVSRSDSNNQDVGGTDIHEKYGFL